MVSQLKWTVLNGPRTKRMLRQASHHQAVRILRVGIWWILMRPTHHRQLVAAGDHQGPSAAWLAGGRPGMTGTDTPTRGDHKA